ncbi:MAG: hypothetical protein CVV41_01790 [Candidatus Riflebacteria bacterium HGW-Riflebacteria-1]|jgi:hypothetical protein|nr:MAG: hypothetical protein CVV41_01790 [Candidatus Riflebacteria bacterium HGW-Riflebacteria-1]
MLLHCKTAGFLQSNYSLFSSLFQEALILIAMQLRASRLPVSCLNAVKVEYQEIWLNIDLK